MGNVEKIEPREEAAGCEKPQQGEIVAVGPGARDESGKLVPLDLKAGVTAGK